MTQICTQAKGKTISFQGDHWEIIGVYSPNEQGKTMVRLRSHHQTMAQRGYTVPRELVDYVPTELVDERFDLLTELFPTATVRPIKSVHIISSCTASKTLVAGSCKARDLYAGAQHRKLLEGIETAENLDITLSIVSARYGLIGSNETIQSYEDTFSGLSPVEIRRKGKALGLREALLPMLKQPKADLTLVLLGTDYLQACDLPRSFNAAKPVVFTSSKTALPLTPEGQNLATAVLEESHTRAFGAGFVALKGEVTKQLLIRLNGQYLQPQWGRQ